MLSAASWNALLGGDLELALATVRTRCRDIDPDGFVRAGTYVLLAYIAAIQQDYDRVTATLAEGFAVVDADEGDHALLSRVTLLIASTGLRLLGGDDSPDAERRRRGPAGARETGHPTSIANALFVSVFGIWRTDPERAAAIMDESIALVRLGASGVVFGLLLAIRAVTYAEAGDHARARAHLRESIVFSTDRGDSPTVATAVDYGIQVMAALGQLDDVAVLAGAISAPQFSPLDSLPPRERTRRDEVLARTWAALGDDSYDAAFARGAAMSLDEVGAYVVRAMER